MKAVVLVVLCALAVPARAEINMADSIEWATADSDVVVRGFLTNVRVVELSETWFELTLLITESVKGGVKQTVQFAVPKRQHLDLVRWLGDQTDLLVFLVETTDLARQERDLEHFRYTIRPAHGETFSMFELGWNPAFTRTFAVVDKPTEVLAAVRRARLSSAKKSFNVDAPFESAAARKLYSGSSVWIAVPVDAQLETVGIAWLSDRNLIMRQQGLAVLEQFKTQVNIDRLKRLLADAELRKGAQEVLKRWQVD